MLAEGFDIWLHKRGLMMQSRRSPGNPTGHETAYQVYGLGLDFDEDVLAAIHKRKTREHHPDTGGDREQFERYQMAYEVLTDPAKRFDERKREKARLQQAFSGYAAHAQYQKSYGDGFAAGEQQGREDVYRAYSRAYEEPAFSASNEDFATYPARGRRSLMEWMVRLGVSFANYAVLIGLGFGTYFLYSGAMDKVFFTACAGITYFFVSPFTLAAVRHTFSNDNRFTHPLVRVVIVLGVYLVTFALASILSIIGVVISALCYVFLRKRFRAT